MMGKFWPESKHQEEFLVPCLTWFYGKFYHTVQRF